MGKQSLIDFHNPGKQDCGHSTRIRCRDCGNCYKCNHEVITVSDAGFGKLECDDGHSKWVPPELMDVIDNA